MAQNRSAVAVVGTVGIGAKYVVLIGGALIMLLPFLWMVNASLMSSGEIMQQPPTWLPAQPQFSNFSDVTKTLPFGQLYFNSLFITTCTVFGVLLTSSLAGFAFAKYQFPGREIFFYCILATMMIPFFVTLIPVFYIVRQLQWVNTFQGMIVPSLTSAYGIFLMRQFIFGIPDELIDAARIDGASEPLIYGRIILPLIGPALATLGTFTFISSWNSFLWPLLVLDKPELFTLPLGLNTLRWVASDAKHLPLLMAGTT